MFVFSFLFHFLKTKSVIYTWANYFLQKRMEVKIRKITRYKIVEMGVTWEKLDKKKCIHTNNLQIL